MSKILTVNSTATVATVQTLDRKATDYRVRLAVAVYFAILNGAEGKDLAAAIGKSTGLVSTLKNGGSLIVRVGEDVTPDQGRAILAYVEATTVKDREWIGEDLAGSDLADAIVEADDTRKVAKDAAPSKSDAPKSPKVPATLADRLASVLVILASVKDEDLADPSDLTRTALSSIAAHVARLADTIGETVEELAAVSA